jgi:hypothetical protein
MFKGKTHATQFYRQPCELDPLSVWRGCSREMGPTGFEEIAVESARGSSSFFSLLMGVFE